VNGRKRWEMDRMGSSWKVNGREPETLANYAKEDAHLTQLFWERFSQEWAAQQRRRRVRISAAILLTAALALVYFALWRSR
jgi:hypothetical protein